MFTGTAQLRTNLAKGPWPIVVQTVTQPQDSPLPLGQRIQPLMQPFFLEPVVYNIRNIGL